MSLLRQAIPQKGLEYRAGNAYNVILVNYADAHRWNAFIENKLCYLRTADSKGTVKLPTLGKEPKYLLLHNGRDLFKLYRLKQDGAKIYSSVQLTAKGFVPSQDGFYLCYELESGDPVVVQDLDCKALAIRGAATYIPHFVTVKHITTVQ